MKNLVAILVCFLVLGGGWLAWNQHRTTEGQRTAVNEHHQRERARLEMRIENDRLEVENAQKEEEIARLAGKRPDMAAKEAAQAKLDADESQRRLADDADRFDATLR